MPNFRQGKGKITAIDARDKIVLIDLAFKEGGDGKTETLKAKVYPDQVAALGLEENKACDVTVESRPAKNPQYGDDTFITAWNGKDVRQQARGGGSPFKGGGGGGNKGGRPERSPEDTASIVVQTAAKSAEALLVAEMAACAHVAAAQVAVGGKPEKLPAIDPNRVRALVQDFASAMMESIPSVAAKVRGE
jgi:hypothetical protein